MSVIANCVNALRTFRPLTYEEFARDYILTGAAERNFQVAIQAALDIASLILAHQTTILPKEYKDLFPALAQIGVLPADFAQRLVAMAKFRVTVQSCIKTVVFVIARSVFCDEAIPRRSIWPDKWEIASPKNGSQ